MKSPSRFPTLVIPIGRFHEPPRSLHFPIFVVFPISLPSCPQLSLTRFAPYLFILAFCGGMDVSNTRPKKEYQPKDKKKSTEAQFPPFLCRSVPVYVKPKYEHLSTNKKKIRNPVSLPKKKRSKNQDDCARLRRIGIERPQLQVTDKKKMIPGKKMTMLMMRSM